MSEDNISRTVKEAMCIRVNVPSLNRNIGKFQLTGMRLCDTPDLHLKLLLLLLSSHKGPYPLLSQGGRGHTFHIYISSRYGPSKGVPPPGTMSTFVHPLVPSVVSMILESKTFSLQPDEAMLVFHMTKACLCY